MSWEFVCGEKTDNSLPFDEKEKRIAKELEMPQDCVLDSDIAIMKNYLNIEEEDEPMPPNISWESIAALNHAVNNKVRGMWGNYAAKKEIFKEYEFLAGVTLKRQVKLKERVREELNTPQMEARAHQIESELAQLQDYVDFVDNFISQSAFEDLSELVKKYGGMMDMYKFIHDQHALHLDHKDIDSDELRISIIEDCKRIRALRRALRDIIKKRVDMVTNHAKETSEKLAKLKLCAGNIKENERFAHAPRYVYNVLKNSSAVQEFMGYALPEFGPNEDLAKVLEVLKAIHTQYLFAFHYPHIMKQVMRRPAEDGESSAEKPESN